MTEPPLGVAMFVVMTPQLVVIEVYQIPVNFSIIIEIEID
jgi:hypothetical protein